MTLTWEPLAIPFSLRQLLRDLDEEAGLQLVQAAVVLVLRPVVEVLGQPVGRADDREVLLLAVDVLVGGELLARPGSSVTFGWSGLSIGASIGS